MRACGWKSKGSRIRNEPGQCLVSTGTQPSYPEIIISARSLCMCRPICFFLLCFKHDFTGIEQSQGIQFPLDPPHDRQRTAPKFLWQILALRGSDPVFAGACPLERDCQTTQFSSELARGLLGASSVQNRSMNVTIANVSCGVGSMQRNRSAVIADFENYGPFSRSLSVSLTDNGCK